jgi:hypothetical protein
MKNYKLIALIFIIFAGALTFLITSIEMPVPEKEITKTLDINNDSVK